MIPGYVEARLRREPPPGCFVVPGSTPVVAFGDPRTARVATLGLNPSRLEFLDRQGRELDGTARRFETLDSLGVPSLAAADGRTVERTFEACCAYFHRNPLRAWFDQLDAVLGTVGASYYAGTACHLDLVQWGTDPTWGRLPPETRERLLAEDVPFMLEQLRQEPVRLLLLNGSGVIRGFAAATGVLLSERGQALVDGQVRTRISRGRWTA